MQKEMIVFTSTYYWILCWFCIKYKLLTISSSLWKLIHVYTSTIICLLFLKPFYFACRKLFSATPPPFENRRYHVLIMYTINHCSFASKFRNEKMLIWTEFCSSIKRCQTLHVQSFKSVLGSHRKNN